MTVGTWALWALFIFAQNASFTWVSRARNSASIRYHALASIFSNGIWFIQMFFVIDVFRVFRETGNLWTVALACLFYTVITVTGSITMHHVLMRYVETGKRKVGAA
jgi:hypothetical protein